jgi:hypothetical protein
LLLILDAASLRSLVVVVLVLGSRNLTVRLFWRFGIIQMLLRLCFSVLHKISVHFLFEVLLFWMQLWKILVN